MVKSLTFKPMKSEFTSISLPSSSEINPPSNEMIKIDENSISDDLIITYNSRNDQQLQNNRSNIIISPNSSRANSLPDKDPRAIPKKIVTKMGKVKYRSSLDTEDNDEEEDNNTNNYNNIQKKSIFKIKPTKKNSNIPDEDATNYNNVSSRINSNQNQIKEFKTTKEDMNRIIQLRDNFVTVKFSCEKDSGWLFLENIVSR